MLQCKSVLIN